MVFDGHQAVSVARGFEAQIRKSGYVVYACSILPCHIHLVIRKHSYTIDQVGRLLRQSATGQLLRDGRHPFAGQRTAKGRLPAVWAQDFWKVFLYTECDIRLKIRYVEENPIKEGKRPQRWPFVVPFVD